MASIFSSSPLGVGSKDNVLPGIDVKAGTDGGDDHGFLFIAPTVRRSKVTGELVAYRWRRPPDLDALADEGPDDTTGEALAALVREARGEGGGTPGAFTAPAAVAPSPWDDVPATLAAGRGNGVFRLASALQSWGVPRDKALLIMEKMVWPMIDQTQAGHPFPRSEFSAAVASPFTRYAAGHGGPDDETADDRPALIDWPPFWSKDRTEREWVQAPLIPKGRAVAIYAPGGEGKSELVLAAAAAAATGRPFLDQPAGPPIHVLYIDAEQTEDDLYDRLTELGYGPGDDLSHLHYALLPDLPPLDTAEGGRVLLDLAYSCEAELVIIDTTADVVAGAENDADTIRAFHRHTGRLLKAAGLTVVRLDHAGKDPAKGQRDTSAKRDDVDVVWLLTRREGGTRLRATKRRMGWVPEVIDLIRDEGPPLRYVMATGTYPSGTADLAATLDRLGVPTDASRRAAEKTLREAGSGARTGLVAAALRWRRDQAITLGTTPGTTSSFQPGNHPGNHPPETHPFGGGTTSGTTGNHPPEAPGTKVPPYRGNLVPSLGDEQAGRNPNRGRYGTVLMVEEEEALVRFRRGQVELDAAADLLREILGAEEVEE